VLWLFQEVIEFEMDSDQGVARPSSNKAMSQRQRGYIESLLIDKKIDESYKQIVKNVLQDGLSSMQASKIIDFLKACIEFKSSFGGIDIADKNGDVFRKSPFGKTPEKVIEQKGSQLKI